MNELGVVYVADKGDGSVKIGTSKKPEDRVKSIGFNPVNVHLSGYTDEHYKLEAACHSLLGEFCDEGEMFSLSFSDAVQIVDSQLDILNGCKIAIDKEDNIQNFTFLIRMWCHDNPVGVLDYALKNVMPFDFRVLNVCNLALSYLIGDGYDKDEHAFEDREDVERLIDYAIKNGLAVRPDRVCSG